jgi:hypothetical protein
MPAVPDAVPLDASVDALPLVPPVAPADVSVVLGTVLPGGIWPGGLGTCPAEGTVGMAVVVPEETGGVTTTFGPGTVVVPDADSLAATPALRGGALPSGRTHVTSRLVQKSGIVVRSVDTSAAAVGAATDTVSAAATATSMGLSDGIKPPGEPRLRRSRSTCR